MSDVRMVRISGPGPGSEGCKVFELSTGLQIPEVTAIRIEPILPHQPIRAAIDVNMLGGLDVVAEATVTACCPTCGHEEPVDGVLW